MKGYILFCCFSILCIRKKSYLCTGFNSMSFMSFESNRHAMNYGLLLGLLFCLNFWVSTMPAVAFLQYLVIAIEIFAVYRMASDCRRTAFGGVVSYGGMLWYILQLFMYGSLISALFKYLFYKVLRPDFLNVQIEQSLELMERLPVFGGSYEHIEETVYATITPLNLVIQSIWINVFCGLIVGLVIAAFLRKDASPFDNAGE